MRIAPAVMLTEEQRKQLEANVRGRSLPARLVERSRIVLLAAAGTRKRRVFCGQPPDRSEPVCRERNPGELRKTDRGCADDRIPGL